MYRLLLSFFQCQIYKIVKLGAAVEKSCRGFYCLEGMGGNKMPLVRVVEGVDQT